MFFGSSIESPPRDEPEKTNRTGNDKRRAPTPFVSNPGHDERCDERADVCAGVENTGGQRTFFFRKPLRHRFDRSGEISRFTEAKKEASDAKPEHGMGQRMAHRRDAPEDYRERESFACADAIDYASDTQEPNRISALKRKDDPAITNFTPTNFVVNGCLENSDHLAIDVVDGGGEEQQRTDGPTIVAHGCTRLDADGSR